MSNNIFMLCYYSDNIVTEVNIVSHTVVEVICC